MGIEHLFITCINNVQLSELYRGLFFYNLYELILLVFIVIMLIILIFVLETLQHTVHKNESYASIGTAVGTVLSQTKD